MKQFVGILFFIFIFSGASALSSPPLPVGGCDCGEEIYPGEEEGDHSSAQRTNASELLVLCCSNQQELSKNSSPIGHYCCCCCGAMTCEQRDQPSHLCKVGFLCSLLWQCTCGANSKAIFCKGGPCWSGLRLGLGALLEIGCSICCLDLVLGTAGTRCDCHKEP